MNSYYFKINMVYIIKMKILVEESHKMVKKYHEQSIFNYMRIDSKRFFESKGIYDNEWRSWFIEYSKCSYEVDHLRF